MENVQKELTVGTGTWCDTTAELIGQALQHATVEEIREQLDHGAKLFHVTHFGEIVGAFVLRIDTTATGEEGVIVACTVKLDGVDMFKALLPDIESRFKGCKSIRYHTARPALARKLHSLGYAPAEIVCIKKI